MRASAWGVRGESRLGSGLGLFALVSLVGVGRLLPCIGEGWPLAGVGRLLPCIGEGWPLVVVGRLLPCISEGWPLVGVGRLLPCIGEGWPLAVGVSLMEKKFCSIFFCPIFFEEEQKCSTTTTTTSAEGTGAEGSATPSPQWTSLRREEEDK